MLTPKELFDLRVEQFIAEIENNIRRNWQGEKELHISQIKIDGVLFNVRFDDLLCVKVAEIFGMRNPGWLCEVKKEKRDVYTYQFFSISPKNNIETGIYR